MKLLFCILVFAGLHFEDFPSNLQFYAPANHTITWVRLLITSLLLLFGQSLLTCPVSPHLQHFFALLVIASPISVPILLSAKFFFPSSCILYIYLAVWIIILKVNQEPASTPQSFALVIDAGYSAVSIQML